MNYQDYHDVMPSDIITKLNKEYSAKNINILSDTNKQFRANGKFNSAKTFQNEATASPDNSTSSGENLNNESSTNSAPKSTLINNSDNVPSANSVNNNAIYFNITYLLNCLINHIDLMIKHTQMPDKRLVYSNYLGVLNNQYKYFSGLINNQIISCPPAKFVTFTKLKCDIAHLELEILQQFNLLITDINFNKVILQQFIKEHLDFLQAVN